MFVNPHNCSCATCVNYLAEREPRPSSPELLVPTPVAAPEPLAAPEPVAAPEPINPIALGRAPANQTWNGTEWVSSEWESYLPPQRSMTYNPGSVVQMLGRSSAYGESSDNTQPARTEEEDLLCRLRALRDQLQEEQDEVYQGETRSHDEMAAQDVHWDELDAKIASIDNLLRVFDPLELRVPH